jgi:hypothetical protein
LGTFNDECRQYIPGIELGRLELDMKITISLLAWLACSAIGFADEPPAKAKQGDIIGTVLGRSVSWDELRNGASQRDELARLFLNPVLEKYRAAHRKELELTEQEIARAIQYHEHRANKKGGNTADAWRRVKEQQKQYAEKSLQEIERQLTSLDLKDEERNELLDRKREAELLINQPGRVFVQHFYGRHKFQQSLYREYGGGRVLFQQFGNEAFDAMHRWLKEREKAGDFRIDNPELRSKLYEYWTNTKMHGAFLSTPDNKQDPIELRFPWERNQPAAKRRDDRTPETRDELAPTKTKDNREEASPKTDSAPPETSQVESPWGSVTGRVVWKGPVSGSWGVEGLTVDEQKQGIRDAFVFLESKPEQIHPDYLGNKPAPAKMVYSNRDFRPRSLVLQVGQPIELTSIDPRRAGNVWPRNLTNNQEFNVTVAKKPFVWSPKHPEPSPVRIVNMADPLARSNWLIVDHPYATVTGGDGSFRLEKLPAGEHTLAIWHEAAGYLVRGLKVKVQAGQVVEVPDQTLTVRQIPRMRLKAPLPTWSEIETVNNMQARLTIDDYGSDTVNGVKSAFAVIEIRNSNGPYAVDFRLSDKKQTELQILDADGEPVEKVKLHFRARKHFPDHGSLPPHCYLGLRTFGSGVDFSRSLDHATFVAWGHAWHLSPGTYTLQGTLEISVREDIRNKETPWKDVSLKLAPIEFVVPNPGTASPAE